MTAGRLATSPLCETLAERKSGVEVDVRKVQDSTARFYELESPAPACIVSFSEEPTRQTLRVAWTEEVERFSGLDVRMVIASAESAGERTEVRGASAQVLHRFPIPALGCALNSGVPSWGCFAGFMRRSMVRFGTKSNERLALKMVLDLSGAADPGPVEAGETVILDRLADADQRLDSRRYDQLEAFLRDPSAFPRGHNVYRQFEHEPEKLSPYADRLMAALEAADAKEQSVGRSAIKTTRAYAEMVAQLPDRDIQRHGDRILAVLDGPPRGWWQVARPLMRRTAILGQAALPMLIGRLEGHRGSERISWHEVDAMIALCRMGLPLAEGAGPKLLEIWRRRNVPRQVVRGTGADRRETMELHLDKADQYLYLALLRLGLRDEAGLPEPRGNSEWWPNAWQSVSPDSPADVCEDIR